MSELVRPRASVGGKEGDGRPTRPLSSLLFARRRGPEQRGDGPSAPRIPVTLGAQGLSFSLTHIQTLTCSPSAAGAAGAAGAASAMSTSLASSALMAVFGLGGIDESGGGGGGGGICGIRGRRWGGVTGFSGSREAGRCVWEGGSKVANNNNYDIAQ